MRAPGNPSGLRGVKIDATSDRPRIRALVAVELPFPDEGFPAVPAFERPLTCRERLVFYYRTTSASIISILLPNNQRQHRTLHFPKDVLPYALC